MNYYARVVIIKWRYLGLKVVLWNRQRPGSLCDVMLRGPDDSLSSAVFPAADPHEDNACCHVPFTDRSRAARLHLRARRPTPYTQPPKNLHPTLWSDTTWPLTPPPPCHLIPLTPCHLTRLPDLFYHMTSDHLTMYTLPPDLWPPPPPLPPPTPARHPRYLLAILPYLFFFKHHFTYLVWYHKVFCSQKHRFALICMSMCHV